LGGGNHFVELCLDEVDALWLMLHSGSRGIGNAIGRYFIAQAKKDMEQRLGQLSDRDLAYFTAGALHFDDYVDAVHWAQDYAVTNRREMMRLIVEALRKVLPPFEATSEAVNCHHNRGRGSEESFCSCSHGAGRRMSRTAAKKRYSARDMERQTEGVECRKDSGVVDEIPAAYKDIDQVMANQTDLVDVVHTLKQVVCVKG